MKITRFLALTAAMGLILVSCGKTSNLKNTYSDNPDRAVWLDALDRVCEPMLTALSEGRLKADMPVETTNKNLESRLSCTYLEALGRVIVGISPWLELGPDDTPEGQLRKKYIDLSVKAIAQGVDPNSPDYLNFNKGSQPLVDAAFLAQGLLRAPKQLWGNLDDSTKVRLVRELKSSRVIRPGQSNWLFFSAMVETALFEFTGEWEYDRVQYAFDRFVEWYKGDGWYGDGRMLHIDYYNSFVIQPMMATILDVMAKHGLTPGEFYDKQPQRYARYAAIQERLISPEGTYPIVGRSLAYRFGAFHALSDVALRHMLPEPVTPAQVRCALTAVISNQINAPGTFDENGWLTVGFAGHQLHFGETYISTGSVFLCTEGLVALGLPETDPFWSDPAADWTSKKGWAGVDMPVDHAINF